MSRLASSFLLHLPPPLTPLCPQPPLRIYPYFHSQSCHPCTFQMRCIHCESPRYFPASMLPMYGPGMSSVRLFLTEEDPMACVPCSRSNLLGGQRQRCEA